MRKRVLKDGCSKGKPASELPFPHPPQESLPFLFLKPGWMMARPRDHQQNALEMPELQALHVWGYRHSTGSLSLPHFNADREV